MNKNNFKYQIKINKSLMAYKMNSIFFYLIYILIIKINKYLIITIKILKNENGTIKHQQWQPNF